MNILMMVTWYSPADAPSMQAGIFHYEQSIDLQRHCNMALYYPFDTNCQKKFYKKIEKGLLTYRSPLKHGLPIFHAWRIFLSMLRIKFDFHPDVIHAHVATGAGLYAVIFGKLLGIPVVLTEHSPAGLAGYDRPLVRRIANFVYKRSLYNACVSPNSMHELKELFPECNFGLVYNGVIAPKADASATEYRIPDCINMSIVATFYDEWVKGYQYLLPAIQTLVQEGYTNVRLHIVGGGIYEEKYKNMAKELGIENQCIFYGNCQKPKVYAIMSQMDFGLSTSLIECSGVSVQEMLMFGKPMVITKSGGANSLVTEDNAIVVDKESSEAIVNGIKEMMTRLDEFDEDTIKSYAYDHFEIRNISRQYRKIYLRATSKSNLSQQEIL